MICLCVQSRFRHKAGWLHTFLSFHPETNKLQLVVYSELKHFGHNTSLLLNTLKKIISWSSRTWSMSWHLHSWIGKIAHIAKISLTSRALLCNIYGWQKAIKAKEMNENSRTSNDCCFKYMLDFILKLGGKLEYQDDASLLKFKENQSIDTYWKSRWKFVRE